jgi:hypothetical protein
MKLSKVINRAKYILLSNKINHSEKQFHALRKPIKKYSRTLYNQDELIKINIESNAILYNAINAEKYYITPPFTLQGPLSLAYTNPASSHGLDKIPVLVDNTGKIVLYVSAYTSMYNKYRHMISDGLLMDGAGLFILLSELFTLLLIDAINIQLFKIEFSYGYRIEKTMKDLECCFGIPHNSFLDKTSEHYMMGFNGPFIVDEMFPNSTYLYDYTHTIFAYVPINPELYNVPAYELAYKKIICEAINKEYFKE